ncbi:MAG: WD40/YVTN/BNR-like repeat-containing protein, partial [Acidiferrobacterales bacterium]
MRVTKNERPRASPNVFWGQRHNGIFRSTDGGRHWTRFANLSPSAFRFACAMRPKDPDTAWFVPEVKDERRIPVDGRLVMNRTRDGGRSFETLHRGLTQEHSYDLVCRHGLAVTASGDLL